MATGPRWQIGLGRENGLTFWGMTCLEGSFGSFFPIWPLYMEELGAPISIVGLLLGLSGAMRLLPLFFTASISQKMGSKNLLIASRLIAAVAIASAAFAPSWEWLLLVMIGSAVGSMSFPIVLSYIAINAGETTKVRAYSLIVTVGPSIAMLIAPLISSGLILVTDSLRAPFVLAGLLSLFAALIFMQVAQPTGESSEEEEDEAASPRGYRSALSHPMVRRILLLKLVTVFSLSLGSQLIPNYLRDVGGYSDDVISLLASFSAFGTIIFGIIVVRSQRFSAAPLQGAAIAVSGIAVAYLLLLMPEIVPFVVLAYFLRGGLFGSISLFSAVLGEATRPRDREHVFTLSEVFIVSGFSTAPIIAGLLYGIEPTLPLIVSAVLAVPIVAIMLRLGMSTPSSSLPEPVTAGTMSPPIIVEESGRETAND